MKKPLFSLLLLLLTHLALGQNNVFIGQYFKIMPAFAPGLTGANNFLDIKTGTRNQWADVEEAPTDAVFFGQWNDKAREETLINIIRTRSMT